MLSNSGRYFAPVSFGPLNEYDHFNLKYESLYSFEYEHFYNNSPSCTSIIPFSPFIRNRIYFYRYELFNCLINGPSIKISLPSPPLSNLPSIFTLFASRLFWEWEWFQELIPNDYDFQKGILISGFIEKDRKMISEKDLYKALLKVKAELSSISAQGFVTHSDVTRMPVVNKFISLFTDEPSYINGEDTMETYKWIFNIIILHLYMANSIIRNVIKETEGPSSDLYADLTVLGNDLHDLLEPSIRQSLARRGMSVRQQIIGALDTEYQNVSETMNELLSIQFAGHTVTYVKIPVHEPWEFVSVHTITGKQYPMQNLDLKSVSWSGRPVLTMSL